ncbi:MAG: carbohydrate kinase family protein [Oscillospiraceae bacterium]|nr:carbohydrate kinase family protein [Candidatus Ruminococcus equi]
MSKIIVCGLSNFETACKVNFPIEYSPIEYNFFGVESAPAGVGLNLSLSFSKLSDEVCLLSYVGNDSAGDSIKKVLSDNRITDKYLLPCIQTPSSLILFDETGRRKIYCDLKDMQEKSFDEKIFEDTAKNADFLCLCNINFSRNLLPIAKRMNKKIACDVHCISDVYDEYNADFMKYADVLFFSNEAILGREEEFVNSVKEIYSPEIIVVGMGDKGSLLYDSLSNSFYHRPSVFTRKVVNTVGAGDALFSSFVHFYAKGMSAKDSLDLATVFASYKIGEKNASVGFLSEEELLKLSSTVL